MVTVEAAAAGDEIFMTVVDDDDRCENEYINNSIIEENRRFSSVLWKKGAKASFFVL